MKSFFSKYGSQRPRLASLVTGMLLLTGAASASIRTWSGGGGNDNWSTAANWGGIAPSAGDDLVFAGTTRLTPNNDITAGTSFNSITFNGGAGAFVVGGNSVVITGGAAAITSNVTGGMETFNNPITFSGSPPTISSNAGGLLVLGGNISASSFSVTVASSGNTELAGVLNGTGSLTKTGGGNLKLSGANTYSGSTTVTAGILMVNNSSALGSSAGGTNVSAGAALDLNGINYSTAEPLTLNGLGPGNIGALINSSATGAAFAGLIALGSGASIVGESGGINLTHSGTITGSYGLTLGGTVGGTLGSALGTSSGTLTKQSSGTWTLANANSFTGATTINAGILRLGNANALGTAAGGTTVSAGAALDLNGINYAISEPLTLNGIGPSGVGALINSNATGAAFPGAITLASASSIVGQSGTINISYGGNISGSYGLTLGGAQGGSLASTLAGGVLSKQGAGTWTLSGSSSLSLTSLTLASGTLNLGSAHTHTLSTTLSISGGSLDFGSSTLQVAASAVDLSSLAGVTPGSGSLEFTGSSNQNFTPKAGAANPDLKQSGTGTTYLTADLTTGNLDISNGTFDLNANAATLTVSNSLSMTGGALYANGGSMDITGNINMTGGYFTCPGSGATWTLAGNFTQTAGATMDANGGILTLNGTSAGKTLALYGHLNNLIVNGSGGSWSVATYNLFADFGVTLTAGTLDVSANSMNLSPTDFTVNGGTLDAGNGYLTISGNFNMTSGTLNPPQNSNTFSVGGNFVKTGGTLAPGNGTVTLNGSAAGKILNVSSTLNKLAIGGSGGWTVTGNGFHTDLLTVAYGTLNLGSALTSVVGTSITFGSAPTLDFGASTLQFQGASLDLNGLSTLTPGSGTLEFTGTSAQTFTPKNGAAHPGIKVNGSGGTALSTYDLATGALAIASGTLDLGSGNHSVANGVSFTGGTLNFNGATLSVGAATVDLRSLSGITVGSGTLAFTGGTAQTFMPHASLACPKLRQNGAGGTTVTSNGFATANLSIDAGALHLGTSLSHTAGVFNSSGGSLDFGSSTLHVNGGGSTTNNFSYLSSVAAGSGALAFDGSGAQTFMATAAAFPAILHAGAGVLVISSTDLHCAAFNSSNGSITLSGTAPAGNITTTGNFTVSNGTSSTFTGLDAHTITVGGAASITAASPSDKTNLDAASAWYFAAAGTVAVDNATLGHCNASGNQGTCSNCVDAGSNTNWSMPVVWDGGGSGNNWGTASNWGGDLVPTAGQDVIFNAGNKGVTLNADVAVRSITMTSGYTGLFDFNSHDMSITGNGDFRTGGAFSTGTGSMTMSGAAAQTLYYPPGSVGMFVQSGTVGTTILGSQGIAAGALNIASGTLNLGSGLTHQITGTVSGTGGLDFGTSNLAAAGTVNLSSLTITAVNGNTLSFTGTSAQSYTANPAVTGLGLIQNGTGGTTVLSNDFTTPSLALTKGTLNLGSGRTVTLSTSFSATNLGGIDFGNSTLKTAGAALDLSGLGTLTAGTGSLDFIGASAQSFTPKSGATHPTLIQSGSGTTTVLANGFATGNLQVGGSGTLHLGSGLIHTIAAFSASGGNLNFGSSTLRFGGASLNLNALSGITAGTGTLEFNGGAAQSFAPKSAAGHPTIKVSGSDILTFTGTLGAAGLTMASGTLQLGASFTTTIASFAATGGTLDFGSSTLDFSGNTLDLTGLSAIVPGTGYIQFSGASAQSFIPRASTPHPNIKQTGTGGTTIVSNDLNANVLYPLGGTFHLGAGRNHSFTGITQGGGPYGSLDFGSSQAHVSGSLDLGNVVTLTPGTGSLYLSAPTGIQYLTPKGGNAPHPAIFHDGAGTLQLYGNNLTCQSFSQSAGTLDFNGFNVSTAAAFTVTNGTSTSFANLTGRTITVGANASLNGTAPNNKLAISATAAWLLNVSQSLTGSNLSLAYSNATGGSPGVCNDCLNNGNNSNWTYAVGWDGGGTNANWSTPANWVTDIVPAAGDAVYFKANSKPVDLDVNATVSGITMDSTYTGNFSFLADTLTIIGTQSDFRSGGGIAANNGALAFYVGGGPKFYPKAGATFPNVIKNGAGAVTLYGAVAAGNLTVNAGTFNLGSGYTHTFGAISGTGTLDFSGSNLNAIGNVALNGMTITATPSNALGFIGASAQTYFANAGQAALALTQNGPGTTTVIGGPFTASALNILQGTFNLGATATTHTVTSNIHFTAGILNFGNAVLSLQTAAADFTGLSGVAAGTGTLQFAKATAQTFKPKTGFAFPKIQQSGSTTTLLLGPLDAGLLSITSGTLDLGAGNTVAVTDLNTSGGSNLNFNSSILEIKTGDATLNGLAGLYPGTGTLVFSAATGTQTLTGKPSANHPYVKHTGAGQLKLAGGDLLCASFLQQAGQLDLNGFNITVGGTGSFIIKNGANNTLLNLGGRSFIVGGNAALSGVPGSHLDLNPLTAWTIDVMGTLNASNADLRNSNATHSAGIADSSLNLLGNANWSFLDSTKPENVTAFQAKALDGHSAQLTWASSIAPDADSVMFRVRIDGIYPTGPNDGILLHKVAKSRVSDTVIGLPDAAIMQFAAFVKDSSGNYSLPAASAQDTARFQYPISGTMAIVDVSGRTKDVDPALAFTYAGADSMRFSLLADTATAAWKTARALDSLNLGADGSRIVAAQFKNVFGGSTPWYLDTTLLDRAGPLVTLAVNASHSWKNWPDAVAGRAVDSGSGTDSVFVIRNRVADGSYYNGSGWTTVPDTAKFRADSTFSAILPNAAMNNGYYDFTAFAKDKLGNVSPPLTIRTNYLENRAPLEAAGNIPDSVLQNQNVAWQLDMGDLDAGDSVLTVTSTLPGWLAMAESPDSARNGYAAHRVYSFTGRPGQGDVGTAALTVQVRDLGGKTAIYSKTLSVIDVNDVPRFAPGQDTATVKEHATRKLTLRYSDADPKDVPVLSLVRAPDWVSLLDSNLTMRPGSRDVGPAHIVVKVSDGKAEDTLDMAVTVANVNDAPYAFPSDHWQSPAQWKERRSEDFSVVVVDMDKGDSISLATALPKWITYQEFPDTGNIYNHYFKFTVSPAQADTGSYAFKLRFQDAGGAFSELPLAAKVANVNDTPTAVIKSQASQAGAARISLDVVDPDGNAASTRFHYRLIGAAGDTVRRGICPGTVLDLHPLADGVYTLAVAAEDEGGLKQAGFTFATMSITGATVLALDSARWNMIGYPGRSLASGSLGAGAALTSWDESSASGAPLGRYASGNTADSLLRGKGYWVRAAKPVNLKAPLGELLDKPYTLKLTHGKQGWNQVGNPFPYFVDLSGTGLQFWEWDAAGRDLINARGILKPWGAYWVQVARDTSVIIKDDPYFTKPGALAKAGSEQSPGYRRASDWTLQMALEAGPYRDQANFLGIRDVTGNPPDSSAAQGGAPVLVSDPPKFGDYIALHFEKPGQNGSDSLSRGYAADFRSRLGADEEWWDFAVENSGSGLDKANLSLPGLQALEAAGLHAFVVRKGEVIAVSAESPTVLAMTGADTHYSLVVSPRSDFAERLKGDFSVSQNFPNPVLTQTTFRFFLPQTWDASGKREAKTYRLRIDLYDFAGRLAAEAFQGGFPAGSHSLVWKPQAKGGGALAKGAYLYRLEVPGFAKTLKLLVK